MDLYRDEAWGLRGRHLRRWLLCCVVLFGLARCTSDGDCCCCDGGVFLYEAMLPNHAAAEAEALRYAHASAAVAAALGAAPTSVTIDEDALGAPEVDLRHTTDGAARYTVALTAVGAAGTVAVVVYLREEGDGFVATGAEVGGETEGEIPSLASSGGGGGDWD